jgi:alpha-1,3-rhamnosyl/mannosyltransferase
VNLLWLVPGVVGGSEEYTVRLLRAVAALAPADLHLTLFALRPFVDAHPDLAARLSVVTVDLDGRHKPRRVATEVTWLATQARRRSIDLLHHAGGVIPPGPAVGRFPSLLTIHDLQPLVMPEHFSTVKRRWLGTMLPRSARRARLVATPSEPASASVVRLLGVPADRVVTVPHGIEPPEPVDPGRVAEVRARYRLGEQVVVYPAITYPHKDHRTLVEAFARVVRRPGPDRSDRRDLTLLLTGGAGPREAAVAAAIRESGVGEQVRRTGRVSGADLDALYAAATVAAVPSRFEGFGALALEAMARGLPLVAADATALPWVVGTGGLLVPPGDVDAWAVALARLLDDPAERARWATAGRRRAAHFTWERAGRALIAAYRRAGAPTPAAGGEVPVPPAMGEDGSP